ncbi:MAG: KH domain-containing protein [Candidatus Borkfalkiaceae bacterium]|nr:KH domain-containing protein [Christensenellaceae bacterium]
MLDLIKYIVGTFAENPEAAEYVVEEKGNTINVTVLLGEDDMGKVIGRQGKIAKAMRTLVKAASAKSGKRYNIDIKEKNEAR